MTRDVERTAALLLDRCKDTRTALERLKSYLEKYHGATLVAEHFSGFYYYLAYNPGWWRQRGGEAPDMDEYVAWVEGDVWCWSIQEYDGNLNGDGEPEDPADNYNWTTVDSCGGYYGYDFALCSGRVAYADFTEKQETS